jgi:hypothetical protein
VIRIEVEIGKNARRISKLFPFLKGNGGRKERKAAIPSRNVTNKAVAKCNMDCFMTHSKIEVL